MSAEKKIVGKAHRALRLFEAWSCVDWDAAGCTAKRRARSGFSWTRTITWHGLQHCNKFSHNHGRITQVGAVGGDHVMYAPGKMESGWLNMCEKSEDGLGDQRVLECLGLKAPQW